MMRDQPPPTRSDRPSIWGLVMVDMVEREKLGIERYGTPLQAFNGRDAWVDAYQEALDLVVYLRQAIEEDTQITNIIRRARALDVDAEVAPGITFRSLIEGQWGAGVVETNTTLEPHRENALRIFRIALDWLLANPDTNAS